MKNQISKLTILKQQSASQSGSSLLKRKAQIKEVRWQGTHFKDMSPEQKHERIKYLWQKVRTAMKMNLFVKKTQRTLDEEYLKQFAQEPIGPVEHHVFREDMFAVKPLPWYLFSRDSKGMQLWQSIVALVTVVETFGVPMTIAVDTFYQIDPPTGVWVAYYITMLILLANIIVCFLKVRAQGNFEQIQTPTFWSNAKPYLKQKFAFDLVGTLGSLIAMLRGNLKWGVRFRLFNVVRWLDFMRLVKFALSNTQLTEKMKYRY